VVLRICLIRSKAKQHTCVCLLHTYVTVSLQSAITSAHPITSIGIDDSEKGVHIAVGSSDGMVRVYDAEKGDWRLTATFDVPSLTGLMDKPWEPPPPRQRPKDETVVISSEPSWRSKGSAVPLPSLCDLCPTFPVRVFLAIIRLSRSRRNKKPNKLPNKKPLVSQGGTWDRWGIRRFR